MAAMNTYDTTAPQGASTWNPQTGGYSAGYAPGGGMDAGASDTNPAGAGADPFSYTQGSLLTPWQGHFSSTGYGGGYSVPQFTPFNYADFGYKAPTVGQFTENYADPAAFRFADFQGPRDFSAPTAEDMKADPGYQARMDAVQRAQTAGAAHGGALRTGGFQKGLAQAVGNQASQEYGNVYNRRAAEHDRLRREGESTYGINQGNTKTAFDTNTANRLAAYNTRQNTWAGNANVGLQENQLNYNIAQGTWDRNEQKARQGYEDKRTYDQSVAAAGAANANQQYQRDLDDYNRSRDEFWTNQDRQSGLLDREANRGLTAANAFGNQMMGAYGGMASNAIGAGDAQAAGYMGSGNAWGDMASGTGNTIGALALYRGQQPPSPGRPAPPNLPSNSGLPTYPGGRMPGTPVPGMSIPGGPYSGMPSGMPGGGARPSMPQGPYTGLPSGMPGYR